MNSPDDRDNADYHCALQSHVRPAPSFTASFGILVIVIVGTIVSFAYFACVQIGKLVTCLLQLPLGKRWNSRGSEMVASTPPYPPAFMQIQKIARDWHDEVQD